MLWLKRNILLVVSVVGALALLGVAIAYLLSEYGVYNSYDVSIRQLQDGIKTLSDYDPTPNEGNITILKNNASVLKKFMAESEGLFISVSNRNLDSGTFKILLDNAIAELTREATNSGITLPPRYKFTFGELQAQAVIRPAAIIGDLSIQVEEVRTITSILFQSRISSLQSIQRTPVKNEPVTSAPEFITDRSITTNNYGISVPYTLSFRCFTPELASVLNKLAKSRYFIVVRKLEVQSSESGANTTAPKMDMDGMGQPPSMKQPEGGMPQPPLTVGARPPPVAPKKGVQPVAPKSAFVKILDEKPILVTMHVDIIRPYTGPRLQPGAAAAAPAPAPGAEAAPGMPPPPASKSKSKAKKMDEDSQ